jgi:hypothetical protein
MNAVRVGATLLFAVAMLCQDKPEPCKVENTTLYFPDPKCHDDERMETDTARGGLKCVKKQQVAEYNAKECVRSFSMTDDSKLIIPLDSSGDPDVSRARLEGFEFRNICPVVRHE